MENLQNFIRTFDYKKLNISNEYTIKFITKIKPLSPKMISGSPNYSVFFKRTKNMLSIFFRTQDNKVLKKFIQNECLNNDINFIKKNKDFFKPELDIFDFEYIDYMKDFIEEFKKIKGIKTDGLNNVLIYIIKKCLKYQKYKKEEINTLNFKYFLLEIENQKKARHFYDSRKVDMLASIFEDELKTLEYSISNINEIATFDTRVKASA